MKLPEFVSFERGRKLPLLPCDVYRGYHHMGIMLGCRNLGLYGIPTSELIDFLKIEIGNPEECIEIGAGGGQLGHHLGVRMTDNWCQVADAETAAKIAFLQQPPPAYGEDVEKLDALEAVEIYRPRVVLGSWISQFVPEKLMGKVGGSPYGIREDILLSRVEKYIHVGNEGTHAEKFILKRPHRKIKAPWIISRSMFPNANVIYIWEK